LIGSRIDTVNFLFGLSGPFLGQTKPELIATGWHFIFNSL
jgi:hypothetical protein